MEFEEVYKLKKSKMASTDYQSSESTMTDMLVGQCITELMNSVISFHKLHLKITGEGSYAIHIALGELYAELPALIDSIAEGYQGACEKLINCTDILPKSLYSKEEAVSYIREISLMITELQNKLSYSEVINDLDNVKSKLNAAKYKLLFLQ